MFRTDNNEDCWKLTPVKSEVTEETEENISLDELAGDGDSDDDQR